MKPHDVTYHIPSTLGLLLLAPHLACLAADPLDQWRWRNPLPNGNGLIAVTYANGTFAATGYGGAISSVVSLK